MGKREGGCTDDGEKEGEDQRVFIEVLVKREGGCRGADENDNIRFIVIISDVYSAFYHVTMFKCTLQAITELTVGRLRSSTTVAHKYFIYY